MTDTPKVTQQDVSAVVFCFAQCLYEPDDVIELRRLPHRKPHGNLKIQSWCRASELTSSMAWLLEGQDDGRSLCIGLNPRLALGASGDDGVALARCLFADFDNTDVDGARRTAAQLPAPTLVINSGHGVHMYWRLAEPLEDLEAWTQWQLDIATLLGSDPCVKNPERLTRLPGFVNPKPPAARCEIIEEHRDQVYDLADFHELIPEATQETPDDPVTTSIREHSYSKLDKLGRALLWLGKRAPAIEGQHGDSHTYSSACHLVRGFDLTDDEAFEALSHWNRRCTPPWSEEELREKIARARKYGTQQYGDKLAAYQSSITADRLPPLPSPAWLSPDEIIGQGSYNAGITFVSSGFESLDKLLDGGFAPGVHIVAGRTGSAKTSVACNLTRYMALDGITVLHLTLEDTVTQAMWRMHAAAANAPLKVLLKGAASQHGPAVDALGGVCDIVRDLPIRFSDLRDLNEIVRLIEMHAKTGGQVVVLDQISKIHTSHLENANSYERVNEVSERLRLAAQKHIIPVVTVSQVNREASKSERDLEITDLRDSGMLEQDAVGVLLINKAEPPPRCDGKKTHEFIKILPVKLGKNRFGPAGETSRLIWYPRLALIKDDPKEVKRLGGAT